MERKSSLESRHKRKLQSDGENKKKRHKGGSSNQHKLDGDIRMETIIYKLDSRNKIVLPRADVTNMDNEFLQYVKDRLEEKSSPTDNGNVRRNSNEKTRKHEHMRNSKRYSYDTDASMEKRTYARNSISKEHRGSGNGRLNHYVDHYGADPRMYYASEKRPSNGYDRNVEFCSCKQQRNSVAMPQEMDQNAAPVKRRHCHADDERRMSNIYDKRPSDEYDRRIGSCNCSGYDKRPSDEYDGRVGSCNCSRYDKRPSDEYDGRVGSCNCYRRRTSEMAYPREENMEPVNGQNFCELSEEQMLQCFQLVFRKLCTLQNGNGTKLEIDVATTNQTESPPVNYNDMQASSTPVENQLAAENTPTNTSGATSLTNSPRNTPPRYTLPHPQPPSQRETTHGSGMTQKAYFYPSNPKRDFTEPVETHILGKQFNVHEQQIGSTVGNASENSPRQSVGGGGERIIEIPQQNQQYTNQVATPTEQQQQQYEQQPHNRLESVDEQSSLTTMEKYPTEFNRESMLRRSTQSGAASVVGRLSLEGRYAQNRSSQQSRQQNSAAQQMDPALTQPHDTNLEVLMGVNAAVQQNSAAQQMVSGKPQQIELTQQHDTNVDVLMGVNTSNPADFAGSIGTHSYQSAPLPMTFPMAPNLNPNSFLRQETAQPNTSYPIYPYGLKNGLQKLSADSVRIIPNITVVDYNETCCSIPICSPVSNTSYEYILMRVKKSRHF